MDARDRRKEILKILDESEKTIKGLDLAKELGVSRQVIVQDIAILRAKGERILATPQGYIKARSSENKNIVESIVCKHSNNEEIEEELQIILDYGGKILDVIVEHPVYGEIKSPLQIASRYDLDEFLKNLEETEAEPLSALTEGVHIHTIEVESEEVLRKIKEKLLEKNYLIRED